MLIVWTFWFIYDIFAVQREDLDLASEDDLRDTEEEQPQVVVLRPGDLTAQEAQSEQLRLERGECCFCVHYTLYKAFRGYNTTKQISFCSNLLKLILWTLNDDKLRFVFHIFGAG